MMLALLVAGIGFALVGLAAIGFGIPVNEFSFGNTLIIAGAVFTCTGALMISLWLVVRELGAVALQLGGGLPAGSRADASRRPAAAGAVRGDAPQDGGLLFGGDQSAAEHAERADAAPAAPPPWLDEAASRDRVRSDVPAEPAEAAPAVKPRRNLLFSSSSRKERERAETRTAEAPAVEPHPAPPPPSPEPSEPPPATFDDAWPKADRARPGDAPLPRRAARTPSTFSENGAERRPPAARPEDPPPVTVLKSGVVDGMAYSLYSDGSIEAQMPEGMMRFASIDELRAHLDQRP
jgi:hypothetical protein